MRYALGHGPNAGRELEAAHAAWLREHPEEPTPVEEAEEDARLLEGCVADCEARTETFRKHAQAARDIVAKLKEEQP